MLTSKYCYKASFTKVSPGSAISHGWRSIRIGRDLLLKHLGKVIGNGESTRIWSDSWIHPKTHLKPIGPVALQDKDLMVSDFLTRETKEWNNNCMETLLPELAEHILSIKPSVLGTEDSYIWPLQQSGEYTVKSGYFSVHSFDSQSTPLLEKN
ncbi:hypothetical protein N665_0300s0005 [Sinapis alba]|nr:hypothetical protein N665_0300s0005 [Sinapis alba]